MFFSANVVSYMFASDSYYFFQALQQEESKIRERREGGRAANRDKNRYKNVLPCTYALRLIELCLSGSLFNSVH